MGLPDVGGFPMIDRGPVHLNGRVRPPLAERPGERPGIIPLASPGVRVSDRPPSRLADGPFGGSRHTTGFLPDSYRPTDCHYRISPRFLAIDGEGLQKGFERLESPLVTGFYAAF